MNFEKPTFWSKSPPYPPPPPSSSPPLPTSTTPHHPPPHTRHPNPAQPNQTPSLPPHTHHQGSNRFALLLVSLFVRTLTVGQPWLNVAMQGASCSVFHGDSPVACGQGGRCPFGVVDILVLTPRQTVQHIVEIPSISLARWSTSLLCRLSELLKCRRGGDSRVRCVDRFMRHQARSQWMVGSCAQAEGQGLLPP